ncbi:hypothetical protein ABZ807_23520 [Micromonospora sp. NPDC047548]|uniref:hypothetical protein n=1 Tax=Micromonospora sp. NPDC047548 TaxID=3155624 RepID=UPI0033F269DC
MTAAAVVANLTVTGPAASGVRVAHPADEARPTTSNVNFLAGETASDRKHHHPGTVGEIRGRAARTTTWIGAAAQSACPTGESA